jgi:uncharacterized protein involved in exopolysaccharide biosynthesis
VFKLTTGAHRDDATPTDYIASEFGAFAYLDYLQQRLRFILLVCGCAGAIALGVSLLLPKQYTATASVVIDPPRGDDPRTSVALTQVYLESLRSYELLASSDTLFTRAIDRFHLRDTAASRSLESWKRRVLKVTKLRDTKVLEIAVTLPDASQAQQMAEFLASETVKLNTSTNEANDRDLVKEAGKRAEDTRAQLDRDLAGLRDFSQHAMLPALRSEIETLTGLLRSVREDLVDSRTEAAQLAASGDTRLGSVRARVTSLESQEGELTRRLDLKSAELARADARIEELDKNAGMARSQYDAAQLRLRALETTAGMRGERLRVIDPGVVPERPSSPNVGLNVALALAASVLASLMYLTLSFRRPLHDRSTR